MPCREREQETRRVSEKDTQVQVAWRAPAAPRRRQSAKGQVKCLKQPAAPAAAVGWDGVVVRRVHL